MAEKSNGRTLLDETKVLLRALMVSNPEALTISQLAKDFQEMEGNPIPFSKLGYKTLTDFLLSMPDIMTYNTRTRTCTAVISENSKNKVTTLTQCSMEETKRLIELVFLFFYSTFNN